MIGNLYERYDGTWKASCHECNWYDGYRYVTKGGAELSLMLHNEVHHLPEPGWWGS